MSTTPRKQALSITPRKQAHANYTFPVGTGLVGERWLDSYAYAANGNLHNPTPRFRWLLRSTQGRVLDNFATRRALKAAVAEFNYAAEA